jgi:hypothetical protein
VTQPDGSGPQDTRALFLAVENQVRDGVDQQVDRATAPIMAVLLAAVAAGGVYTAVQIVSRSAVYKAITAALGVAQAAVVALIGAGYTAGAQLGRAQAAAELGLDTPPVLPDLGRTLPDLLADVRTAISDTQSAIINDTVAAHDGVTGENPIPARVLTVKQAVQRAVDRLRFRLTAAGVTGVHQGVTDAQAALYRQFAVDHPDLEVVSVWTVTSAEPCGYCAALDGTAVAPDSLFDAVAGTPEGRTTLKTYGPLTGPPRHPNCRCRLRVTVRPRKVNALTG